MADQQPNEPPVEGGAEPRSEIATPKLGESLFPRAPRTMGLRAAGRALEGIVVKNDQLPISAHLQVLLDVIGTNLDGAIVGLPCVLWS